MVECISFSGQFCCVVLTVVPGSWACHELPNIQGQSVVYN